MLNIKNIYGMSKDDYLYADKIVETYCEIKPGLTIEQARKNLINFLTYSGLIHEDYVTLNYKNGLYSYWFSQNHKGGIKIE